MRIARLLLHRKDGSGLAQCICGSPMVGERSQNGLSYRWRCERQLKLKEPGYLVVNLSDEPIAIDESKIPVAIKLEEK